MLAGLDGESGEELDDTFYFANDLLAAAEKDPALHARMRDAARRMLRSMFAAGLFDDPPAIEPSMPPPALRRRATPQPPASCC